MGMDIEPEVRDEYDDEPKCDQCKGAGWWVLFNTPEDCLKCERTGIDLVASGYNDVYQESRADDPGDRDKPHFVD